MLSKACIVGIYQRKLEYIAAHDDVELLTLVPPNWRDERGIQRLERVHTHGYRLQQTAMLLNGNFHLHLYPEFGDYLHEFQPDIVHIDEEPYNIATWHALLLARRYGARTIFFSWQNINRRYPLPFRWGERWVLDHIDCALMGTQSAAQVWREKGYRGPIEVIPQFGTDPELFRPHAERPSRPFTIGYVGRLVEEKGVHLLLEAASLLAGDWQVRIVGGGPLQDALVAFAAELGIAQQVIFVGQVPSMQMPAEYAQFDTLALPSLTRPNWKEQFGRVLIEAMACGLPVVGSDSGAIPDVIGAGGLIFPEGDIAGLAGHLRALQTKADLRDLFGMAGRRRVLGSFTHERIAADTVAVYRNLLQLDRPPEREEEWTE